MTIREILQKVYNDGMLAGAKSTGERNYGNYQDALNDLAEIVRGERREMLVCSDMIHNEAIDHIAKLFEEAV